VSRPAASGGERSRVPEAESPAARSDEQEVASGRTAATPVAVLTSTILVIAALVLVVLAIVVVAYLLA
jgi:hypothetical protein